jgi:hypothetical protein
VARIEATVPDDHLQRLAEHARANDRTLAAEVRRMVRLYLQAVVDRTAVQPGELASSAGAGEPTRGP